MFYNEQVQIKFSKDQVHPGEVVSLEVKAESGSLCSVRSVDKGLLLHEHHDKFNLPNQMVCILKTNPLKYILLIWFIELRFIKQHIMDSFGAFTSIPVSKGD